MKYYYTPPKEWKQQGWKIYFCDHPLYNRCTLYLRGDKGLAVVQKYFNEQNKASWWGSVRPEIAYDLQRQDRFDAYFQTHASEKDDEGFYFTVSLRTLMWALRMKPLQKEYWEDESQFLHRV